MCPSNLYSTALPILLGGTENESADPGQSVGHQPHCSESFRGTVALRLYSRVSEMPWGTRVANHYPDIPRSHQEALLLLEPLGIRRVPIPHPGLCVDSSLGLYPEYHEDAHGHSTPCIKQLLASLFGAVDTQGKHKCLGPAGPS